MSLASSRPDTGQAPGGGLRRVQAALLWLGFGAFALFGLASGGAAIAQYAMSLHFDKLLAGEAGVAADGLVGRLDIPRLGLSTMIREGSDSRTLLVAAGHLTGTALPGKPGNVVVSGHRDTFFRE